MSVEVFNPLDKRALAESIEAKLLEQSPTPLSDTSSVKGAGIYAIYYSGGFPAYSEIANIPVSDDSKPPVYVGKAVPKGSRKGGFQFDVSRSTSLRTRLRKHANVISQATNLDLSDFHFRSLVVDDVWIPLGENILIENFRPIWNVKIDGFGNNKPGVGRTGQKRSSWDTLHPGRGWADTLPDSKMTLGQIVSSLKS